MRGSAARRPAAVGDRVVLRYRRDPGSVPSQSDALGMLESLTPHVRVRTADGTAVTVAPDRVVVLKTVPPKPVRTTAIRGLERAIAESAPHPEWIAGWVAWADDSAGPADALATRSAVPLADAAMPEGDYFHDLLGTATLHALTDWFSRRGLPLTLRLPDRLVRPPAQWQTYGEHTVLTRDIADDGATAGAVRALDGTHARVATGAATARVRLAGGPDGPTWAVLTAEPTGAEEAGSPDATGSASPDAGAGAALPDAGAAVTALCAWAAGRGATRAVLAVPDEPGAHGLLPLIDDAAARALGFTDHHRARFVRPVRAD